MPHLEGEIRAVSIDGLPTSTTSTVEPGENIVYKVKLRNPGTEGIQNTKVQIPIPYNAKYVSGSALSQMFISPTPTPNSITFNPSLGVNGTLIYDVGTLPAQANVGHIPGHSNRTLKKSRRGTQLLKFITDSVATPAFVEERRRSAG